eukprot:1137446-Pelagomonas_calceolata.AAC.15
MNVPALHAMKVNKACHQHKQHSSPLPCMQHTHPITPMHSTTHLTGTVQALTLHLTGEHVLMSTTWASPHATLHWGAHSCVHHLCKHFFLFASVCASQPGCFCRHPHTIAQQQRKCCDTNKVASLCMQHQQVAMGL